MALKTVIHKGYHGTIEVNTIDYSLHGSILFIDEEVCYIGQSFMELEQNFQKAVEAHIQACKEKGQDPPFAE